jgi:hypothetical protein
MAVKVTEVPAQIVFPGLAAITTEGVRSGFTVVVEVAGFAPVHPFASV